MQVLFSNVQKSKGSMEPMEPIITLAVIFCQVLVGLIFEVWAFFDFGKDIANKVCTRSNIEWQYFFCVNVSIHLLPVKGVENEQSNMLQAPKLCDSQIASVILTKVFVILKIEEKYCNMYHYHKLVFVYVHLIFFLNKTIGTLVHNAT